jgi:thiol-disulfide isomerase/thioredoxin
MEKSVIESGMSYQRYRGLIHHLLQENKTTGDNHSEDFIHYTQLNEQRMNRNEKQVVVTPELKEKLLHLDHQETWVVFAEAWCGDCAQIIPVIAKIADASEGKIDLRIIVKSEHKVEMQHYLTNGAESVPKLVRFETETLKELGTWGARPEKAQAIAEHWKLNKDTIPKEEFNKELHLWYAKDKGNEIQKEFLMFLNENVSVSL